MNISVEKVFTVNAYYHGSEVYQTDIKLTIQSIEKIETYLSDVQGKMDLVSTQNKRVVFIVDSDKIPIPEYVNDVIISANAENLAWQFEKQYDTIYAPSTSVCTIDDFSLDEEEITTIIQTVVEMIELYWTSVKGGIYES
jgi:hypothetical protein